MTITENIYLENMEWVGLVLIMNNIKVRAVDIQNINIQNISECSEYGLLLIMSNIKARAVDIQ